MNDRVLVAAKRAILSEAAAVSSLANRLDGNFVRAVELLLATPGRAVAIGVGKSGQVARKVASTLTSTGTPSIFLHPVEALHGDLGLVREGDVSLAFSNSGATDEVLQLLPLFRRMGVQIITFTGAVNSPIANKSDVVLDCSVTAEACPHNLAPTSSALAAMAMGDALAIAVLEARGFSKEDFAQLHPGGRLGRQLMMRVSELMHSGADMPSVARDVPMREALLEMTGKRLGCTMVVDGSGHLAGIFTDGDLRRLTQKRPDFLNISIGDVMGAQPKTIDQNALATAALAKMEQHSITQLAVVNDSNQPVGVIHLHDLLKAGIV